MIGDAAHAVETGTSSPRCDDDQYDRPSEPRASQRPKKHEQDKASAAEQTPRSGSGRSDGVKNAERFRGTEDRDGIALDWSHARSVGTRYPALSAAQATGRRGGRAFTVIPEEVRGEARADRAVGEVP